MRKERKTGRLIRKRIFLICEGAKTEPNYFKSLINDCNFVGKPIEIIVVNTLKNTPKELVFEVFNRKELGIDETWVVFDRDGYTKHKETFALAEELKVNIAFSSISFEIWILLHFTYIKSMFKESNQIIEFMKRRKFISFRKNDPNIYYKIKHLTEKAIKNAVKLRDAQFSKHPSKKFYEFNPITNVDILVKNILNLKILYKK